MSDYVPDYKHPKNSYEIMINVRMGVEEYFKTMKEAEGRDAKTLMEKGVPSHYTGARRMIYETEVIPFLRSFNPKKYFMDFVKKDDKELTEKLQDFGGVSEIDAMTYIALYPDLVIRDMKKIDKSSPDRKPLLTDQMEKEIRAQSILYKPYLERLHYYTNPRRYLKGEGVSKETAFTKETEIKNSKEFVKVVNTMSAVNMARKLAPELSTLELNQMLTEDKPGFEKKQFTQLYHQLKKTAPLHVLTNTGEFDKMRDALYDVQKKYDHMGQAERTEAVKKLKKLAQNYIRNRQDEYEKGTMNPRSKSRFKLAHKITALCRIANMTCEPFPENVKEALSGQKQVNTQNRTSAKDMPSGNPMMI